MKQEKKIKKEIGEEGKKGNCACKKQSRAFLHVYIKILSSQAAPSYRQPTNNTYAHVSLFKKILINE